MTEQTQPSIQLRTEHHDHDHDHERQDENTKPDASHPGDREPPPPPIPSSDPRLAIVSDKPSGAPSVPAAQDPSRDIFRLAPSEALKLLSASVELLVRLTGDIPPTPPPKAPTYPQMSDMQAEKLNIARSHSDKDLAARRRQAERDDASALRKRAVAGVGGDGSGIGGGVGENKVGIPAEDRLRAYSAAVAGQLMEQQKKILGSASASATQSVDGVHLRHEPHTPTATDPTATNTNSSSTTTGDAPSPEPYLIIGADSQPINLQHGAITRKFYSKNEPPISVGQYLLRMHQFCPMSTAVYLATSLYIHRLAVEERAIPVTRRNAHRLVLAGLRVAMKALEDLSYPHGKMARVGGVSEAELARLEISFCFLTGFELVVSDEILGRHWDTLRQGGASQALGRVDIAPTLKLGRRPREVTREVCPEEG